MSSLSRSACQIPRRHAAWTSHEPIKEKGTALTLHGGRPGLDATRLLVHGSGRLTAGRRLEIDSALELRIINGR